MTGPELAGSHEDQPAPVPRIYVASLSDYVNGRLHGTWLDIDDDTTKGDLETAIGAMLATSPAAARGHGPAEEWAIHDYESWASLRLGEYESLDRLLTLAAGLREHGPAFAALVELGDHDPDDDLLEAFDDRYRGDHASAEDYGLELLSDLGVEEGRIEGIPESLAAYLRIDAAAFVRDLQFGGDITIVEHPGGIYVFDCQ